MLISLEAIDGISPEQLKKAQKNKDKMLEFYNELLLPFNILAPITKTNWIALFYPLPILKFKKSVLS